MSDCIAVFVAHPANSFISHQSHVKMILHIALHFAKVVDSLYVHEPPNN